MLFHLQALDYESKRDYEFRVEVKNTYLDARFIHGLQFKDYATVKVTVEDVDEPPVFTRNPYIIEVHEDTAAGSFVGVVSARDPDADTKPVKYATRSHCFSANKFKFSLFRELWNSSVAKAKIFQTDPRGEIAKL